ncbi:MAG: DUF924 domain-containing protein [Proteobacteria bacterium]|nr:DUF924 domain-containing protein [Pseudomonadota bacterium]
MDYDEILRFWFVETAPRTRWAADPAFDRLIGERYGAVLEAAARAELAAWRGDARGRLAEVIVLDQFSRNAHRGTARAFANDAIALVLAQEAVAGGHDQTLAGEERAFLYMPYMHSESKRVHVDAVRLFASLGPDNDNYRYELRHKAIIDRYGRYPHRNDALGRVSTPEEIAFLKEPGSRF